MAILFAAISCSNGGPLQNIDEADYVNVPFRGNVYVTGAEGDFYGTATSTISRRNGSILSWNDEKTVLSLYIKTEQPGNISLVIKAGNVQDTESSVLTFSDGESVSRVKVSSRTAGYYDAGTFKSDAAGYKKIDITGSKASPVGAEFARIEKFLLKGSALKGENIYLPENQVEDQAYWCRRGPSVHFFYTMPQADVEWFYNEAVVPEGSDIPCSYYMLTGFKQGYMGIQTHEPGKENTVLFSVWSPQETDDASAVTEENRVRTLRVGEGVTARDFGGEGSGGQSFMEYPWKAGQVLKTLVQIHPTGTGATDFTGYFCDEKGVWHLIASFRRPKTDTWYTGAYSFLECFMPESSIFTREVHFRNQWARLADGTWEKVGSARFSCDNTGRNNFRADYFGGQEGEDLVLRHCGFFDEQTPYGTTFSLPEGGTPPEIDFTALKGL